MEDKSVPSSLEERSPTSHVNAPPPGVRKPTLRRYVPQWLTSPLSSVICKTRQMPVPAPHRLREEQLTYPLRTGPSTQKTMTEANCQHHH